MVFLNEIFQIHVLSRHLISLALQQLCRRYMLLIGNLLQFVVDDALAQATLIDETHDVRTHRIVGEEVPFVFHQDDVISRRRQYRLAHLAFRQSEGSVVKLLQRLALRQPRQFTALGSRALVIRQATSQCAKVGSFLQGIVDGVDTHFGGILLLGCGTLSQQQQDVGGLDHATHRVDARLCLLVNLLSLSLHVGIVDEHRTDLLVAISSKLLLERRHRIQMCLFGSLHLQLIVDEQVEILLHILLVDHALGIVLVERILKFRSRHRLSIDNHNRGVVLRRCAANE